MDLVSTIAVSIGLAMDAFAVAIANGMQAPRLRLADVVRVGLCFGLFQGLMTITGFLLGHGFCHLIQSFDHWIAFVLLGTIGGKMLYDAIRGEEAAEITDALNHLPTLLSQGVATSIDALAVGVSFSLLNVELAPLALSIAVVAATAGGLGVVIGQRLGLVLQRAATVIGGVVLVAIGLRILISHLLTGI